MATAVTEFLSGLDHPLKPAIELARTTILGLHPKVREEIKWNSPSFLISDHFATISVGRKTKARPNDPIMVVLHRGAMTKAPKVRQHQKALQGIVKQWIATL